MRSLKAPPVRRRCFIMKNTPENTGEILDRGISGYHQYILTDPIHLCFVSRNLCDMLGYEKNELLSESEDLYSAIVHPDDKKLYTAFIHKLKTGEQTLSAEYRILKKNGGVIYVSDTVSVRRLDDGTLAGCSVLTDITAAKNEIAGLQLLNGTVPFGFLRYTCEKQPEITYMNKQMMEFLRLPEIKDGELNYLDMYKGNIFLMIPMEERRRFSVYLNRVYTSGAPAAGDMTVLRCDGTKARLFGWITKCVNEHGREEFQSVCMDVTEQHNLKKEKETERYIKALSEVYDKIFEYNRSDNTVKCLFGHNSAVFRWLENIPMSMKDATEKWIVGTVCDEDRERVRDYFSAFYNQSLEEADSKPPVITYRAMSSKGKLRTYSGIFLKMDSSVSLFCCRNIPDEKDTDELKSENITLKGVNDLMLRFTEGIIAFEVEDDKVKPLYTSDNVRSFFGYTKEEWSALAEKKRSVKDFISQSGLNYNDIKKLFSTGEAEFSYFDITKNAYRRIKAVCSQKYSGKSSRFYVMLYNVDDRPEASLSLTEGKREVRIRTFGYFDVFVNSRPIAFRSQKSKELFALLVDRRGGYVSSEEAISFLWEDEPVNSVTLARYRKVALRLKNILEEYGISDIIESVDGKRRLVTEKVECDLYDYLSGKEEYSRLFKGSYLTNYSWGETTLAELTGKMLL